MGTYDRGRSERSDSNGPLLWGKELWPGGRDIGCMGEARAITQSKIRSED